MTSHVASSMRPAMFVGMQAKVPVRAFGADAPAFIPKEEVTDRIVSVVKDFHKVDPAKVTPSSHFMNDLKLDSLDTVELVLLFEDEFGVQIADAEAEKIQTVEDAVVFISTHPNAK